MSGFYATECHSGSYVPSVLFITMTAYGPSRYVSNIPKTTILESATLTTLRTRIGVGSDAGSHRSRSACTNVSGSAGCGPE